MRRILVLMVIIIGLSVASTVTFAFCNNNGVPEPNLGETRYACPADFQSSGTIVQVDIAVSSSTQTPSSGSAQSQTQYGTTITASGNYQPVAINATITPDEPDDNQNLVCSYIYSDPDGDPQSGTIFKWFRNGIEQPAFHDMVLPYDNTSVGDVWSCQVTPKDGKDFGAPIMSYTAVIASVQHNAYGAYHGPDAGTASWKPRCIYGVYLGCTPWPNYDIDNSSSTVLPGNLIIPGIQGLSPTNYIVPVVNTAVTNLNVTTNQNVYYVYINVTRVNLLLGNAPELRNVYQYFKIDATSLTADNTRNLFIGFKVDKSWLYNNNFQQETVVLERYDGSSWVKLPTAKIDENNSYIFYKSQTPGFSYFAIVGGETNITYRFSDMLGSFDQSITTSSEPVANVSGWFGSLVNWTSGWPNWSMPAWSFNWSGVQLPSVSPDVLAALIIFTIVVVIVATILVLRRRGRRRIPE